MLKGCDLNTMSLVSDLVENSMKDIVNVLQKAKTPKNKLLRKHSREMHILKCTNH